MVSPTSVGDIWSGLGSVFVMVPEQELRKQEETIDLRLTSIGDILIKTNIW